MNNVEAESPGAIVIGASSGIGRELALLLARSGYRVGVTARRRRKDSV